MSRHSVLSSSLIIPSLHSFFLPLLSFLIIRPRLLCFSLFDSFESPLISLFSSSPPYVLPLFLVFAISAWIWFSISTVFFSHTLIHMYSQFSSFIICCLVWSIVFEYWFQSIWIKLFWEEISSLRKCQDGWYFGDHYCMQKWFYKYPVSQNKNQSRNLRCNSFIYELSLPEA